MNSTYQALFDEGVDRIGTHAVKWDGRKAVFGNADVVPMWVADTDFAAPPEVVEALCARARHGAFGYSDHWGGDKAAACRWLKERGGISDVSEDWLVFCPGVVDALYIAIHALTEKDDLIAIQPPVYGPFRMSIEKAGRRRYDNNLIETAEGWRMDLENLEEGLKKGVKALLLCSPHNPVGRVWTKRELADLVALLNRYGARLISDEIHGDLILPGYTQTPAARVPGAEKAVMAIAPSKTFNLAGLSHSFFVIRDEEARAKIAAQLSEFGLGASNVFGEIATEAAYTHGGPWLDALNEYIDGNRELVAGFLAERVPEARLSRSEGTFLLWIDLRAWGLAEKELNELLVRNGVGLTNGTFFGDAFSGWMRMNIGTPRRVLREGLANFEKAALEARAK